MDTIKKYFGILLFILGPLLIFALVDGAFTNINPTGTKDINNPLIWIIIISIFTPIAIGLMIFGWYAFKGEYNQLPASSEEL